MCQVPVDITTEGCQFKKMWVADFFGKKLCTVSVCVPRCTQNFPRKVVHCTVADTMGESDNADASVRPTVGMHFAVQGQGSFPLR